MGAKQSTAAAAGAGDAPSISPQDAEALRRRFDWGPAPEVIPSEEKDPNDLCLQSWAFCKAKPSPVKHYRSDMEERARRVAMQWRKRSSFMELDCGEDSFFVANTYRTIGIADGVGGWKDEGVDPAEFSNALMENAKHFTETHRDELNPETIMQAAFDKVVVDRKVRAGSSTCCIATLKPEGNKWWLDVANLGDSGLLVVRNREILHRVHEKIHAFNSPFQLAVLPPHLKGRAFSDRVLDSIREKVEVRQGDVIVMGTDGLFDNRFNSQLASDAGWIGTVTDSALEKIPVVGFFLSAAFSAADQSIEYADPYRVAQRVVHDSYKNSISQEVETPWSQMLQEFGVKDAKGGKVDDITVVLARVSTREEMSQGLAW